MKPMEQLAKLTAETMTNTDLEAIEGGFLQSVTVMFIYKHCTPEQRASIKWPIGGLQELLELQHNERTQVARAAEEEEETSFCEL